MDTNVISELARPARSPQVVAFVSGCDDAWLSIISIYELEYGILRLADGKRKDGLRRVVDALVAGFSDRLIDVGAREAYEAASMRVRAEGLGRVLHLADALIGGTARTHDLSLATRNIGDFYGLPIDLVDPWRSP